MAEFREVFVLGLAMHPATRREAGLRLEEMVYDTSRRALADSGATRGQLDNVVLAASDELDGRPISSMLLNGPAGGYLTDEIKVTDNGLTALCLAFARIRSGDFDLGMVASWCKSSKTSVDVVMRYRADPFYLRPLGLGNRGATGLFAQAVAERYDITESEVNLRVNRAFGRAARNDRGLRADVPDEGSIAASQYDATPVRIGQIAPPTDGAVSIIVASGKFLRANPQCQPIARITGVGWSSDSYQLGASRLGDLASARKAWDAASTMAGLSAESIDLFELDCPTGWHEAAYARAFGITEDARISPSGGAYAQNPFFCAGLINAAEAILQVAGRAGAVQVPEARRAVAHGCHGFAQQGNVAVVVERVEELS